MALSPIEDRYLSALTAAQFPDMPVAETQQPVADATQFDGMQLAAAPTQVVSDAGGGRGSYAGFNPRMDAANKGRRDEMRAYDPTTRERIASFLQAGFEGLGMDRYKARQNAQTLIGGPSSNLPLDIGIADVVPFLGTALQTEEAVRMGGEAVESAKAGELGTAALQAGGAALGLVPGAAGTIKAAKALPQNLPVGMSTQAIGGMDGVLTPTAKAAAPVNDMGFYSAVEQAALNIQRKSGTGQAMLNDITKGQDVKLDEVKWIGLDDFLKGKKNVTREEVQQFIAANKVDIKEVTLDSSKTVEREKLKEASHQALQRVDEMIPGLSSLNRANLTTFWAPSAQAGNASDLANIRALNLSEDQMQAVMEYGAAVNRQRDFIESSNGYMAQPKFGQYTLPGGENYREILLTMPDNTDPQKARLAFEQRMKQKYGSFNTMKFTDAEKAESESTMQAILDNDGVVSKGQVFKSSHWDEPNVLAHIRVNDRVDADGKKMLLVEEVQSDWHQAGRDKGYKDEASLVKQFADLTQQHREIVARRAEIVADLDKADEYKSLAKQEQQLIDEMNKLHDTKQYGVPDAPMKDTWYQLALKRVLKYAADNGYERVGLTTGARQAERYDLSKQVDGIFYTKNDDGTFNVSVAKGDSEVWADTAAKPERLSEVVGKDIAKKIVDGEGSSEDGAKALRGLDLQVGGEGMKKYYDEVYPQFLAKYGKKWGAKVGETSVPYEKWHKPSASFDQASEPVRFVDITPEMRQGVGKGQPLFSATAAGAGTGAATMQDKEKN